MQRHPDHPRATGRFTKPLLAGALLALAAGTSQAAWMVGLTSSNALARFDTANIGASTSVVNITGLAAGDRFVGIDLRPSDNMLYGITLSNQLYTLNETTGVASLVAALSSAVVNPTLGYGIDFNPVADFGGAASLRFVSSAGGNFAINANTGAVTVATGIAAGYSGVAYSNSVPGGPAPGSTALYYIDSNNDTLAVATASFNAPTIGTVGALGVDVLRANGFEILGNGMAYAALNVDAGTSLTTDIYGINLTTGAATMMGAGLLAMGFLARRRRQAH